MLGVLCKLTMYQVACKGKSFTSELYLNDNNLGLQPQLYGTLQMVGHNKACSVPRANKTFFAS